MKQQEIGQVYPGLTCFKDGVREIPIESIPGLRLTGWRPSHGSGTKRNIDEILEPELLAQALRTVLNQVGPFHDRMNPMLAYMRIFEILNLG